MKSKNTTNGQCGEIISVKPSRVIALSRSGIDEL